MRNFLMILWAISRRYIEWGKIDPCIKTEDCRQQNMLFERYFDNFDGHIEYANYANIIP